MLTLIVAYNTEDWQVRLVIIGVFALIDDQRAIVMLEQAYNARPNLQTMAKSILKDRLSEGYKMSKRTINQGDIYWLRLSSEVDTQESVAHPYIVIQDNVLNHSRLQTVVVCALTTNIKKASYPGNILLDVDEANLPKQSIIEVGKVRSIDKAQFGAYIGMVSPERIQQIYRGMLLLQRSFHSH